MNRCPTGASSRRTRSAGAVPLSATPAAKAPTMGASSAASASNANASVNASASATNVPALRACRSIEPEEPRSEPRADRDRDDEERERDPDDRRARRAMSTVPAVTTRTTIVSSTRPMHVVGDRGAQHGARFDARQCAEIAEHAGGDPHARRGERGAEEQRGVAGLAECERDADAQRDGHHHADDATVSDDFPTERRSLMLSSRPTSSSSRITPSSPRTSSVTSCPTSRGRPGRR